MNQFGSHIPKLVGNIEPITFDSNIVEAIFNLIDDYCYGITRNLSQIHLTVWKAFWDSYSIDINPCNCFYRNCVINGIPICFAILQEDKTARFGLMFNEGETSSVSYSDSTILNNAFSAYFVVLKKDFDNPICTDTVIDIEDAVNKIDSIIDIICDFISSSNNYSYKKDGMESDLFYKIIPLYLAFFLFRRHAKNPILMSRDVWYEVFNRRLNIDIVRDEISSLYDRLDSMSITSSDIFEYNFMYGKFTNQGKLKV